ncbi:MAG: phosphoribosylformylglycinamidine synthase subunit PurL [Alphaproteobacteria bacterium]
MSARKSPDGAQISSQTIAAHGLTEEEFSHIVKLLGRQPSVTELGVFSVMWSEHCSYKSSKVWLQTLPTTGPQVICGPGENAGVVDIGDGQAAIFKMESHNHPSFIEPYQGAATGVGGIMRDVFTMGARPVANLNALRFGSPDHPKTRHLVSGVVAGIGGYGNCFGVPTVGGETGFDPGYNGNILVNAMCVGVARRDKIFYSAASGQGFPVVYVGAKTGRDGIHGATMASAEFDDATEEKRPTVQVGDPFTEKLLLEACLELMDEDAIIAIQDMGAAGLTSSSVEMASKGNVGIELDLDQVPQRETAMSAYEMLLSESQERMLMVLRPECEARAREVFEKWQLDIAIIGRITDTGRFVARHQGTIVADIPLDGLESGAPHYNRPYTAPIAPAPQPPRTDIIRPQPSTALKKLMGSPHLASRRWIWQQYDHTIMANTLQRPGGDAGVVRVGASQKALAMATDVTPRYCAADPKTGATQAVAECWRNLVAVGATPLAITNCLNFGNPERPEIMGQFVAAIEGISAACTALDFPVVSGNVSLYNETHGTAIPPTPTIGGLGLVPDISHIAHLALREAGDTLVLIGAEAGHLNQSLYELVIDDQASGPPPPVDLAAERAAGLLVLGLIRASAVNAVHDISDGGLYVCVAEMALAGNIGADLRLGTSGHLGTSGLAPSTVLFSEDQGRYVLGVPGGGAAEVLVAAKRAGVPARLLGAVGGSQLTIEAGDPTSLSDLRKAHETWLPDYMDTPATLDASH